MRQLSIHVLDIAHGRPAAGVAVTLYRLAGDGARVLVRETRTNADGRTDEPLLSGESWAPGTHELVFGVGAYFSGTGTPLAEPPFLDLVPVRFTMAGPDRRYHVALLVSPWSYSTYRGS